MDSSRHSTLDRSLSFFLFALVLLVVAIYYAIPIRDSDIWFHLLYGRFFITNHTIIPDHTIYSWTPASNSFIYCSWLSDIFLYCIYCIGKVPALLAFRYTCMLLFVAAVGLYARRLHVLWSPFTWLICLVTVLMANVAMYCKPEILSYVFMTLTCWNWWHIKSGGDTTWKNVYLFPVITLLWMNSHGGVIFGFLFLGLVTFSELLNELLNLSPLPQKTRQHLLFAIFLSLLTLFMTPYGFRYPAQLVEFAMPTPENLAYVKKNTAYGAPFEFSYKVLDFADLADIALVLVVLVALPLVRSRKIECSFVVTNIVFAFLYTRYFRTTFWWAPVLVFSLLYLLACRPAWLFPRRTWQLLGLNSLILLLTLFLAGKSIYDRIYLNEPSSYFSLDRGLFSPYEEAEYIQKHYPGENIGCTYGEGAYLAWKLWPQNKVMMDARQFPYRSWFSDYNAFTWQPDLNSRFMERFPCSLWCVSYKNFELLKWFHALPEWELAYLGPVAAVFVKKELLGARPHPEIDYQALRQIKSGQILFNAIKFATLMQEWQAADVMLARVAALEWQPIVKRGAATARRDRQLFHAFAQHDYQEANRLLDSPEIRRKMGDTLLCKAYMYLGQDAWKRHEDRLALGYFQKAHEIMPTQYTRFNLDAMLRYFAIQGNEQIDGMQTSRWRAGMSEFLRMKHGADNLEMMVFQEIALAMLRGTYVEPQPPILYSPQRKYDDLF